MLGVCLCFEIRFEKNHGRLPGHGRGRPALRLHRGHGQLLLGGEPDPARGRPPVPHDRYVSPSDASPGQGQGCSGSSWLPFVISSLVLFSLVKQAARRRFVWHWWVIRNLKKQQCSKGTPVSLLWPIRRLDGNILGFNCISVSSDFSIPFLHTAPQLWLDSADREP